MESFSERLAAAVRTKRTPLVVGLDPHWELLPDSLQSGVAATDRLEAARRIETFCREVIDAVAPLVPALKPQWAFFEQWGSPGLAALERVCAYAQTRGLLIIADAKRGDIGTTANAYAAGFWSPENPDGSQPQICCDALTVNPYLGMDTLQPFLERARKFAAGIFVLVKTSNPGSGDLQDLRTAAGERLYEVVARHVTEIGRPATGHGYGEVGAVVGATYPEQLAELRTRLPHSWILVPGFGAQGGSAGDVAAAFDSAGLGALINSSRGIIFAQRQAAYRHHAEWQTAVAAACQDSIAALRSETTASRL